MDQLHVGYFSDAVITINSRKYNIRQWNSIKFKGIQRIIKEI